MDLYKILKDFYGKLCGVILFMCATNLYPKIATTEIMFIGQRKFKNSLVGKNLT